MENNLRAIPKVDVMLELAAGRPEGEAIPRSELLAAIRQTLEDCRQGLISGRLSSVPQLPELLDKVLELGGASLAYNLKPVINATGVVLHTNLGRAILSQEAAQQAALVASSYSTLEYNLHEGGRGSRHSHLEDLLIKITGGQAAMVVNNNAAAVLLIMSALFKGRELIVSRGELVEIGGAFRIPDIMELGGVILREVGTTNKTRLKDFAGAVDPEKTGGFLKVHTSNFRLVGYTAQPDVAELANLAHSHNLPFIFDLGSGTLTDLRPLGIYDEPTVAQVLKDGADLVCFSGDKLLGGTQAGIIVGRRDLVQALKAHQLARVVRVDKMTLAGLEATLKMYLEPEKAIKNIPTLAMILASPSELKVRAEELALALAGAAPDLSLEVVETMSQIGGGAAPERHLPSWAVAVKSEALGAAELESRLRLGSPPVITRIQHDQLIFDVRTILPHQLPSLVLALSSVGRQER